MKKFVCFCILFVLLLSCTMLCGAEDSRILVEENNFNGENVGDIKNTVFASDWKVESPFYQSQTIEEENGNRFFRMNGFAQMISPESMVDGDAYEFSVKMKRNSSTSSVVGSAALFVRAVLPVLRQNPSTGQQMGIEFYETDWYQYIDANSTEHIGGSGIGIFPEENKIRVLIRTYVSDGLNLGVAYHDFDYPAGATSKSFVEYTIRDNGKDRIEIYANNVLLVEISFSECGSYDDDDYDINDYFQKATMKDGSGRVVSLYDSTGARITEVDNALIGCDEHYMAFGCRASTFDIDDISIYYVEDNTPTPGDDTGTLDETIQTPSPLPNTTPEESIVTIMPTEGADTRGQSSTGLYICIAICCVVILAATVAIIFMVKRKKER